MPATRSEDLAVAHEGDDNRYEVDSPKPPPKQVQSNVLRSMDPLAALHLFFRITNLNSFREFVKLLLPRPEQIDTDRDIWIERFLKLPEEVRQIWPEALAHILDKGPRIPKRFSLNLAFTWTGLAALDVNKETLESFPEAFRDGMAARAGHLGDSGDSAPERWDGWLGNREVHGLLSIVLREVSTDKSTPDPIVLREVSTDKSSPDPGADDAVVGPLERFKSHDLVSFLLNAIRARALPDVFGFAVLHVEVGEKIITPPGTVGGPYRIEHFGFRDGVSQPFADAGLSGPSSGGQVVPAVPPPGGGTARPGGTWDPIALGELLLGHPDEDGIRQLCPANATLRKDGTYLVFRKLEQDVIGFRRFLAQHDKTAGSDSRLAAQMVGRWPNGTSLVTSSDLPTVELPKHALNDFRYQDTDARGRRCPLGAHARRVNPRDSNNRDEARRHRLWRRSISYGGAFLPYDAPDDGRKRGLLFIALCSRLDQQFEFVQTRWLNGGEAVGHAGTARCPLVGPNSGDLQDSFAVPDRPAPYTHLPRFVTTRGGDYFFMPSIPALHAIARGETFDSPAKGDNPGIDETPRVIDPEALFKLGRKELLPHGKPPCVELNGNGIFLVGRHALVKRVLRDDATFSSGDQKERIRRMTGGELLMLGAPITDPVYRPRVRIWQDAARHYGGPPAGAVAAQAMRALLARHGPAGKLDLVRDVSVVVPLVVARHCYGVTGPEWASPTYVASLFNKLDISQVPHDWLEVLPHIPPQDMPYATLAAWTQIAFAEVFINIANARELAALAARTTAEFFRHLDRLVTEANPSNQTLLGCLMGLNPGKYTLKEDRFRVEVRLLLAEIVTALGGTLIEALPNVLNYLLDQPDILAQVQQAAAKGDASLEAAIREILRFDPVAPILFRRCERDTYLDNRRPLIPGGSMVAVLLKTAMFDQRVFTDPDQVNFGRDADDYLHFGYGPHACRGVDVATPVLREMVKAIIGLKGLRRAAGPQGNAFDALGRYQSLVVRFNP
jgi:Dyp-type peroxidase family